MDKDVIEQCWHALRGNKKWIKQIRVHYAILCAIETKKGTQFKKIMLTETGGSWIVRLWCWNYTRQPKWHSQTMIAEICGGRSGTSRIQSLQLCFCFDNAIGSIHATSYSKWKTKNKASHSIHLMIAGFALNNFLFNIQFYLSFDIDRNIFRNSPSNWIGFDFPRIGGDFT